MSTKIKLEISLPARLAAHDAADEFQYAKEAVNAALDHAQEDDIEVVVAVEPDNDRYAQGYADGAAAARAKAASEKPEYGSAAGKITETPDAWDPDYELAKDRMAAIEAGEDTVATLEEVMEEVATKELTTSSAYEDAMAFVESLSADGLTEDDLRHLRSLMQRAVAIAYRNGVQDEGRRQSGRLAPDHA